MPDSLTYRVAHNAARIRVRLTPEGPFLIKARESLDPTRPDMEFVRLYTPLASGGVVYVPGSSLKGVTRANLEALISALNPPIRICNPLDLKSGACASSEARRRRGIDRGVKLGYWYHCDACKMFGSTDMAGRFRFTDMMPWSIDASHQDRRTAIEETQKYLGTRQSVAISRDKGQAKGGALFDMEVISGGSFYGEITAHNYELWQLGLLLLMFDRIDDGTVLLGFGKSRGLGRVRLGVESIQIEQFGKLGEQPGKLRGALCGNSGPEIVDAPVPSVPDPLGVRYEIAPDSIKTLRPLLHAAVTARYQATGA